MQLGAYEIAIIGVGSTIIGALLGAWLGYRFALSLAEVTGKRNAAMKLIGAFRDEILALNPAQFALKEELPTFLEGAFQKHRAAIFDYCIFLKPTEKAAFLKAWYTYYCHEDRRGDDGLPFFEQYSCRGLTWEQEHAMKKLARDRIENILGFAKEV